MRLEARQIDDGRGPYRWRAVIRTPDGLALGTIYDRPEPLNPEEAATVKFMLAEKYETREAAA